MVSWVVFAPLSLAVVLWGQQESIGDGERIAANRTNVTASSNPLVQFGEAIEKATHSDVLDDIPGSRDAFWTGKVASAVGTSFACTLFGSIVTIFFKPCRTGTIACLLGTAFFFVLGLIEGWMSSKGY